MVTVSGGNPTPVALSAELPAPRLSIPPKPTTVNVTVELTTDEVAVTVSFPPFWPRTPPPRPPPPTAGAFHTAVGPLMRSVAPTTETFTVAVEVPNWSLAVSWKASVTGTLPKETVGATKPGGGASPTSSVTKGPAVWVQANVAVGQAFGSSVTLPRSVTWAREPTTKSAPALTMGAVPVPVQFAGVGAGEPGQGVSCPTRGPVPKSGPEPSARKGMSWKLFGGSGWPNLKPSGKMKSKFGARYCPHPRPFANPSPPGSDAGVVPS